MSRERDEDWNDGATPVARSARGFRHRVDAVLTRIGLACFRSVVARRGWRRHDREDRLRSIHASVTYPVYATKTILYAVLGGIGLGLLWVVVAPPVLGPALQPVTDGVVWLDGVGMLVGAMVTTVGGALIVYIGRWWYVDARASHRAVLIDESLPRTVAFVYALSRSGMVYSQIFRTVALNRHSFGESAEEIAAVIKDVDLFGVDVGTGLRHLGRDSPSERFSEFAENLANVLRSGRNVSRFLRTRYEQLQQRRLDHQRRLLDLYAALGEAYVAVFVAGPLFLVTILLVFGLLTGGTIEALRLLIYGIVPLANLGFIVYVGTISGPLVADDTIGISPRKGAPERRGSDSQPLATDGGNPVTNGAANCSRLAAYDQLRRVRQIASRPIAVLVERPTTVFYLTGPIAVGVTAWIVVSKLRTTGLSIYWIDDLLVLVGMFLFGTFAIVQEVHSRRLRQVEGAIPDFLDRLASANEAGLTFTEALKRVDRGDLGRLDVEVGRLVTDIAWGGRTERAMLRFADRLRSPSVVRVVALITNAMYASGRVGPVVRIAADEARQDHRLRTKRREEMVMYTIIIYLAFAVFLGIALALRLVLVPAMPTGEALQGVAQGQPIGVSPAIDVADEAARRTYLQLLFHGALVQATCSGFVAGLMGERRDRYEIGRASCRESVYCEV